MGLAIAICCALRPALADQGFEITSPEFQDNGTLQKKHAGKNANNPNCVGDDVSPPLAWSNVPQEAKSLALLIHDQQGMNGLGVAHLAAYGISPALSGFKEGELTAASEKFVGGKNTLGTSVYFGPCPPAGTGQHHYVITLIATDLEPSALPSGLTRDELLQMLKGHARGAAGLVARYAYP